MQPFSINLKPLGIALLASVSLMFSAPVLAVAGKFQFVNGEVQVLDVAGKARAVKKGDAIDEGETVASGANGFAQIRMEDGGFFAVRPDTEFKIDTFKYEGKEDGSEKGIFSLVKGSLRSVTGIVGKKHKENYKINTATATIGIRGSGADVGHNNQLGTAVRTLFGGHSLTSNGKTVNTGPGQTALAPPGQEPKFVPNFPFNSGTTGNDGDGRSGDTEGEGSQVGASTAGNSDSPSGPGNEDQVVIPVTDASGQLNLTDNTRNGEKLGESVNGGLGSGVAFSYRYTYPYDYSSTRMWLVSEDGYYKFSVDSEGGLIEIQLNSVHMSELLADTNPIVDGANSSLGVVWGRWGAGFAAGQTSPQQFSYQPLGGLAFIYANQITTSQEISALGPITATYALSGATLPMDSTGATSGILSSANASVNFSNNSLTVGLSGQGGAAFGSWNATGSGSISMNTRNQLYSSLSGSSTVVGAISGEMNGALVGAAADGLIASYILTGGNNHLNGAALLVKTTNVP